MWSLVGAGMGLDFVGLATNTHWMIWGGCGLVVAGLGLDAALHGWIR